MALSGEHVAMIVAALEVADTAGSIPVNEKGGLRVHANGPEVWVRLTAIELDPVLHGEVLAFLEKEDGELRTQGQRLLILNRTRKQLT